MDTSFDTFARLFEMRMQLRQYMSENKDVELPQHEVGYSLLGRLILQELRHAGRWASIICSCGLPMDITIAPFDATAKQEENMSNYSCVACRMPRTTHMLYLIYLEQLREGKRRRDRR